jgi:cytoskeleton protein RodZ
MQDENGMKTNAAAGPYVGSVLRSARLAQQLSLKDAAQRLNISVSYLAKLEDEDFEGLPGSAYVIGFLRSYARLLGLDAQSLVADYNSLANRVAAPSFEKMPMTARPPQRSAPAIASIFVILAGLAYGGWHVTKGSRFLASPQTQSAALPAQYDGQNGAPVRADDPLAGADTVMKDDNAQADGIAAPVTANATIEATDDAAILPEASPLAQTAARSDGQIVRDRPDVADVASSQGTANGTSAAQPVLATASTVKTPNEPAANMTPEPKLQTNAAVATLRDPEQEITIRAVASSWVEIIRSDGESVMTKLMRAGDSYVVDSGTQFYLSTGNAGGLVVIVGEDQPRALGKVGEIVRDMPLSSDKLRETL